MRVDERRRGWFSCVDIYFGTWESYTIPSPDSHGGDVRPLSFYCLSRHFYSRQIHKRRVYTLVTYGNSRMEYKSVL